MSVCVCVHTKCVWPLTWNLFWVSMASPNYGLNTCHLILRIAQLAPCLSCNLNSRSLDVFCGLYHSDRGGSGSDVSFSYVWTHASWPVWRQACNLPKPTETDWVWSHSRPYHFVHLPFRPFFCWFFLLSPSLCGFGCVYFSATSFPSLQLEPFVLRSTEAVVWSVFICSHHYNSGSCFL